MLSPSLEEDVLNYEIDVLQQAVTNVKLSHVYLFITNPEVLKKIAEFLSEIEGS